jgi:ribosomal protein L37E
MTRPKTRDCPRCGNDVKKGVTVCDACGFNYNSLGAQGPEPASA